MAPLVGDDIGTVGAVVSTVKWTDDVPSCPLSPCAVTTIVCAPFERPDAVKLQLLVPVADVIEPPSTEYWTDVIEPPESDAVPETGTLPVPDVVSLTGDEIDTVGEAPIITVNVLKAVFVPSYARIK